MPHRNLAGVDLGRSRHVIHLTTPQGKTLREWSIKYTPAEIRSTAEKLAEDDTIVLAEDTTDPLVTHCRHLGCDVFVAPARRMQAFRTYITSSGRKDDSTDAWILTQAFLADRSTFRRYSERPEDIARLYSLTKTYARYRSDRVRHLLRLRQTLHHYYVQALSISPKLRSEWLLRLLAEAPTPAEAQKLSVREIEQIIQNPRASAEKIHALLAAESLPVSDSAVSMWREQTIHLVHQAQATNELVSTTKTSIRRACRELEDEKRERLRLIRSMPGMGETTAAIVFSHGYESISKGAYHSFRAYSGIAPITRASGNKVLINMRHVCNRMLRDACYHAAGGAIITSPGFRGVYDAARERGLSHGCSLRVVGNAQARRMFGILAHGEPYSEKIAFPS